MQYVYILKSKKDNNFYVGCTKDMKNRVPLELIHYEAFLDIEDAFAREKWLKTGWGKNHLNKMLNNYQKNLGG
jgi:putative endonuclease